MTAGTELRRSLHRIRAALRRPLPGRFQPYNHTCSDRYPWLFSFAACEIGAPAPHLLSFGCSKGEELLALRRYFPGASVRGLDIDPRNIRAARRRVAGTAGISLAVASDCSAEQAESYDAIFCLAVLCHGDLVPAKPSLCDPLMRFADFEKIVAGFARCLKPRGLLFLHTCNFRFCDTTAAGSFDVVLHADPENMAPDRQYDRLNRLIEGPLYRAVGFRKKDGDGRI